MVVAFHHYNHVQPNEIVQKQVFLACTKTKHFYQSLEQEVVYWYYVPEVEGHQSCHWLKTNIDSE